MNRVIHPEKVSQVGEDHEQKLGYRESTLLVLIAFLLVAAFAAPHASSSALWTDELFSLTTAEDPPREIIRQLFEFKPGYFDHPPLYFILLHYVLYIGNSPLVLRLLSLVTAALGAGLVGVAVRRSGASFGISCAASAFAASHPLVLEMSGFVRMYGLVLLEGTIAWIVIGELVAADEKPSRSRLARLSIALAAVIAATIYTTYFGVLLAGGMALLAVAGWMTGRRGTSIALVAAVAAAMLLAAPWLPALMKLLDAEKATAASIAHRLQQGATVARGMTGSLPGSIAIVVGVVAAAVCRATRRSSAVALASLVLAPFVVLVATAKEQRLLEARYLIFALPVLVTIAAVGWQQIIHTLEHRTPGSNRLVIGAILLVSLFQGVHTRLTTFAPRDDWWHVAHIIEANATPADIILTGGYLSGEAVVYHLDSPDELQFLHYVTKYDDFARACRNPRVTWFINAAPLPPDYQAIVEETFAHRVFVEGNGQLGHILVASKRGFSSKD